MKIFKKILFVLGISAFLGTLPAGILYFIQVKTCLDYPDSFNCLEYTATPQYKEITSFGDSGGGSQCSRPIKGVSHYLNRKTGEHTWYQPSDYNESKLFCYRTSVFEYKGKLTVLQKPEVVDLISKYQYNEVTVKALEFKYIEDKEYVNRLLPQFSSKEIGCIIVLETRNEKKIYLEDEELETFEEIDYQVFEVNLNKVTESDRRLFMDNLN